MRQNGENITRRKYPKVRYLKALQPSYCLYWSKHLDSHNALYHNILKALLLYYSEISNINLFYTVTLSISYCSILRHVQYHIALYCDTSNIIFIYTLAIPLSYCSAMAHFKNPIALYRDTYNYLLILYCCKVWHFKFHIILQCDTPKITVLYCDTYFPYQNTSKITWLIWIQQR